MKLRWAFLLTPLAAAAVAPRSAEACSCIQRTEGVAFPLQEQTGVPANTRIWVGDLWDETIELRTDAGDLIQGTVSTIEGNDGRISVFTPSAPLADGRYNYRANGQTISFQVNQPADTTNPEKPMEVGRQVHSESEGWNPFGGESSCGSNDAHYVALQVQTEGIFTVVAVNDQSALDGENVSGHVTTFGVHGDILVGRAACIWSWPEAEDGAQATIRYGTFDLAGNFSGWTEGSGVEIEGDGCSCTAVDARDRSLWLIPAFACGVALLGRGRRALR